MKFTLALAQINTQLGVLPANLEKHLEYIQQARAQGAGLVVFPELSLTGYVLQDLVPGVASQPTPEDPTFGPLLKASRDIDILVSYVAQDNRARFFIAAAYLSGGAVSHIHHKVYLPTYGMFDEGRFWAAGDQVRAFDTRFGRMGVLICEDFWHASPPYLLWMDGAELLIFISASPGRGLTAAPKLESAHWVEHVCSAYASLFTCFVASTNRVGFEDGITFWGGASAFGPTGELLAQGPYHEEALTLVDIDFRQMERTRARLPLLRDERPDLVQRELARILAK